jgi:hypothetical protein
LIFFHLPQVDFRHGVLHRLYETASQFRAWIVEVNHSHVLWRLTGLVRSADFMGWERDHGQHFV